MATSPPMHAMIARAWQAQLETERGEFAAAGALLDEVTRGLSTPLWPQSGYHVEARAALAIWQGRLDDARTIIQQGLEWLAGTEEEEEEEEEHFRSLLTLGLRAEADRAEQARARRLPDEAATARQLGAALLGRLRQLVDQTTAPQPDTLAHATLGEAEATRLDGHPDPDRWAGRGRQLGTAGPTLPGRLCPLAASRGAAHPTRRAGRGHQRAAKRPCDC
jgi:hypothetical protein